MIKSEIPEVEAGRKMVVSWRLIEMTQLPVNVTT